MPKTSRRARSRSTVSSSPVHAFSAESTRATLLGAASRCFKGVLRESSSVALLSACNRGWHGGARAHPFRGATGMADTPAAPDCFAQCIATFDTAGAVGTFVVPFGAVNLTATLAGAAGAPAANSIDAGVGGSGGAATISLAASTPGSELKFGLGAVGQGSYLVAPSGTLIAVAGGGGGAGFAGYFGLPDQVLGSYAGGNGGSPISAGVHAGENGVEFPGTTTQGLGGVGNAGGTGAPGAPPEPPVPAPPRMSAGLSRSLRAASAHPHRSIQSDTLQARAAAAFPVAVAGRSRITFRTATFPPG